MKNLKFKFTVLLIFIVSITTVYAGDPSFVRITSDNRLSENWVNAVQQDHWGFVWIGTKNGLDRYDGNTMKHYSVDDVVKKQGNHSVYSLYEDSFHQLWVGTGSGVYIYNPYTELFSLLDMKTDKGEQITNTVQQITADRKGNIWMVALSRGVFRYNVKQRKLKLYKNIPDKGAKTGYNNNEVRSICVLRNGEVWFGTVGAGLYRYDSRTDKLTEHVVTGKNGNSLVGKKIYSMCEYGEWIVLGENEGKLMKYNPRTKILTEVNAPNAHYKIIMSLASDGSELFVGTLNGLYIIDEQKGTEQEIKAKDNQLFGLLDSQINTIYLDYNHGLWIGTMMSGACYMPRKRIVFSNYLPTGLPNSLSSKRVRDMQIDKNGNVWIANEDAGVDVYYPKSDTFEKIPLSIYRGGSGRLALMADGNVMWSGIYKNGLDQIDIRTHAIKHYSPEDLGLQGDCSVFGLMRDSRGKVWIGTGTGLYVQSSGMHFKKVKQVADVTVPDIAQDKDGNVWVATMESGVYCINPKTGRSINYTPNNEDNGSITSRSVNSITIDHANNMWFSTDGGGICMFNRKTKRFKSYTEKDGLPDDVVYKILEDKHHYLWFGTGQGLVRLKPGTKEITVYRNNSGLLTNKYNYKSAVATRNGKLLFGGKNGFVAFDPLLAGKERDDSKVYITNLRVNNKEVHPAKDGILTTNILHAKEIELPYDMTNISFDISSLNYLGTEGNNYEYALVGVDREWNVTQDGRNIVYSQLQPGSYTLKVRHAGDDAHITELNIIVRHPWWSTMLARIIYLLLICIVIYAAFVWFRNKQVLKLTERNNRFIEEKDKELLRAKITFFTGITHEIRTPLTLINGSMENIQGLMMKVDDKDATAFQKNLGAIDKNCKRLLNLINQLLEFRKMDSNSMSLNFTNINIGTMMRSIVSRFEPTISGTNKTISLDMDSDDISMQADSEAVTKIVSNLLNNARKYSDTFIKVSVKVVDNHLELRFTNDGNKIPADKADEIFKPFIQLDDSHSVPGSGLGLPMARSLAEMHGGRLVVNTASAYNEFVLTLPMTQENVIETNNVTVDLAQESVTDDTAMATYSSPTHRGSKKHTVLIVEDNAEVMQMISDKLGECYNIVTACNGREGLDKVHSEPIDIIISDVMMPVMDGLEMCKQIKNDINVNSIPIIILTARQSFGDLLGGLKAGADVFLSKPFSMEELQVRIENLISSVLRHKVKTLSTNVPNVENCEMKGNNELLMEKIVQAINKNIGNSDFHVDMLAKEVGASRAQLHRKMKEMTGIPASEFIRNIRLEQAARLLSESKVNVTQVAYAVGFSNLAHFSTVFRAHFGVAPSEYMERNNIK